MKNTVLYPIFVALVIFMLSSLDSKNPDGALFLSAVFLAPVIMALLTGKTLGGTGVVHWKKQPGMFWSALAIWLTLAFVCFYIGIVPPETFTQTP